METFDLFNEMVPDWALTGIAQTAHATKAQHDFQNTVIETMDSQACLQ